MKNAVFLSIVAVLISLDLHADVVRFDCNHSEVSADGTEFTQRNCNVYCDWPDQGAENFIGRFPVTSAQTKMRVTPDGSMNPDDIPGLLNVLKTYETQEKNARQAEQSDPALQAKARKRQRDEARRSNARTVWKAKKSDDH